VLREYLPRMLDNLQINFQEGFPLTKEQPLFAIPLKNLDFKGEYVEIQATTGS
jgi:hypothetical protein